MHSRLEIEGIRKRASISIDTCGEAGVRTAQVGQPDGRADRGPDERTRQDVAAPMAIGSDPQETGSDRERQRGWADDDIGSSVQLEPTMLNAQQRGGRERDGSVPARKSRIAVARGIDARRARRRATAGSVRTRTPR